MTQPRRALPILSIECSLLKNYAEKLSTSCRSDLLPVNPDYPWHAASQLVLIYAREEVEADYWLAELKSDKLYLTLGTDKLQEMKAGVIGVPLGKDDYAIGPDVNYNKMTGRARWKHECIWFWSRNPVNQHPEPKTK